LSKKSDDKNIQKQLIPNFGVVNGSTSNDIIEEGIKGKRESGTSRACR
jgi:hypothetical protein